VVTQGGDHVVTPVSPARRVSDGCRSSGTMADVAAEPLHRASRPDLTVVGEGPTIPEPAHVFPFAFSDPLGLPLRAAGIWPFSAVVSVNARELRIRYGPWSLRTPVTNVASARVVPGPGWMDVVGPPRVSLRDGSVTFATARTRAVRLRLLDPVPGGVPLSFVRHPAVTVTVRDPEGLVSVLDTLLRPG